MPSGRSGLSCSRTSASIKKASLSTTQQPAVRDERPINALRGTTLLLRTLPDFSLSLCSQGHPFFSDILLSARTVHTLTGYGYTPYILPSVTVGLRLRLLSPTLRPEIWGSRSKVSSTDFRCRFTPASGSLKLEIPCTIPFHRIYHIICLTG